MWLDLLLRLGAITAKSSTGELWLELSSGWRHELLRSTKGIRRLSCLEGRIGSGLGIDLRERLACLLRVLLGGILSHWLLLIFDRAKEINEVRGWAFGRWLRSSGCRCRSGCLRLLWFSFGKGDRSRGLDGFARLCLLFGEVLASVRLKVVVVDVFLQRVGQTGGGVLDLGDL